MIELPASSKIKKIVEEILRGSKCIGVFPTPVDKVISYTDLKLDEGIDLSNIPQSFLSRYGDIINKKVQLVFSKILDSIDLREKTIYLDLQQNHNCKLKQSLFRMGSLTSVFPLIREISHGSTSSQDTN